MGLLSGYEDEAREILTRFQERWTTGEWDEEALNWTPLTPVAYPGIPFVVPGQEGGLPLQSWVRIQILGGPAGRASIGGPIATYRHDGDVAIEIYAPAGRGYMEALALADRAAGIFRAWECRGMHFFAPRVIDVGTQGGWHRKNVLCPFWRTTAFAHQ